MENNTFTSNQAPQAMTGMQMELFQVEAFLSENYRFRRNILSGKTEVAQAVIIKEGETTPKEAVTAPAVMTESESGSHGKIIHYYTPKWGHRKGIKNCDSTRTTVTVTF